MKRAFAWSWLLGIPWLLVLGASAAQSAPCQNNLPESNPDSVYIDHGDGTVTDTRTGLMWKQCAEGLSGATCQTGSAQSFNWDNALSHADASNFGGYTDWRLPNVKELSSLVEDCRERPSINMNRFPNTPSSDSFWSSSPYTFFPNWAWSVLFSSGTSIFESQDELFHYRLVLYRVRLVRDGQ